MTSNEFFEHLDSRIAKYDLLCHPFYKAWSAGELTRDDLREYARDYYHHVEAFPDYLAEFGIRLDEGELRQAVLANLADEKGLADDSSEATGPHSELWLDFVEGMGGDRDLHAHKPITEVAELTRSFHRVASEGTPEEALAAFYAYESQVPRIAKEKAERIAEHVRRGRENSRLLYVAHHCRHIPLTALASATRKAHRSQSRNSGKSAGSRRECRQSVVASSGWNRSATDATSRVDLIRDRIFVTEPVIPKSLAHSFWRLLRLLDYQGELNDRYPATGKPGAKA